MLNVKKRAKQIDVNSSAKKGKEKIILTEPALLCFESFIYHS